jgi:hypothetical protein
MRARVRGEIAFWADDRRFGALIGARTLDTFHFTSEISYIDLAYRTPFVRLEFWAAGGGDSSQGALSMRARVGNGLLAAWCVLFLANVVIGQEASSGGAENEALPVLRGRLIDDKGAPVTDATVELIGSRSTPGEGTQHYEARSNSEGRYEFASIKAADEFRLRIKSTRWVGISSWSDAPRVSLAPSSSVERDFTLPRACHVLIGVVDENRKPVPGVRIYVSSLTADRFGSSESVSTDKLGFVMVGGLAPSDAEYLFGMSHKDYAFAKLQMKLDNPEKNYAQVVTLAQGVNVVGTALCSDGKPATGWSLYALPDWWRFGVYPNGAKIGADGSFVIPHVGPGKYDLTVLVPSGGGMSRSESVQSDVALPAEGQLDVRIKLPSPGSMSVIAGRLRLVGGKPTGTISVDAMSEDRQQRGSGHISPGEDTFSVGPLPPGRYRLSFSSTEIEEKVLNSVEAPTAGLEVELQVTGKPRIAGRVTRQEGDEPLSNLRVRVVKLRSLRGPGYVQEAPWRVIDDADGRFEVDVVGPGVYQIVAVADGMAPTRSKEINTDDNRGTPIELTLAAGSSLSGTVVNEAGEPIDGATVIPMAQTMLGAAQRSRSANRDEGGVRTTGGAFTLPHLAVGEETLRVEHPDYCFGVVEHVAIASGENTLEPIVLKRGGSVRGRVFDGSGKPATGIAVRFQDSSGYSGFGDEEAGRLATAVTNSQGEYEVQHLPEALCYVSLADEWDRVGAVRQAILPVDGETHTLDFGGPQAMRGELRVNGAPLADTRVQVGGESPHFGVFKAFARTDGEGRFSFWGLPPGKRTLHYVAPGTRNEWLRAGELEITRGTTDLGTIDAETATVTVNVTGLPTEFAEGIRVSMQPYDEIWTQGNSVGVRGPRTSGASSHVITQIPPGSYEVLASRGDNVSLRQRVDVPEDESNVAIELAWPPGIAKLHGRMGGDVVDAERFSPPRLWSKDRRVTGWLIPKEGGYELANLPSGEYFLTDKDVRDAAPVLEFRLEDGEDRTLDLTPATWAPKPVQIGMLTVSCYDGEGVPLPGADVALVPRGGGAQLRPHSAHDAVTTFVTEPGDYDLSVKYAGYEPTTMPATVEATSPDGGPAGRYERIVRLKPLP